MWLHQHNTDQHVMRLQTAATISNLCIDVKTPIQHYQLTAVSDEPYRVHIWLVPGT